MLISENPDLKILTDFKILEAQNPELKIFENQKPEFKILRNPEFEILTDFNSRFWKEKILDSRF